ncbi:hypothetical protein VTK26DRAFT_1494 [Humicola hyalothermophila]
MGNQYSSPVGTVPQPAWPQQGFGPNAAYPPRSTPAASGIPYAYGQLPANVNPNDPKSQHPIPGSYNRQAFNPKTQSFVPAGGMPMQPPPPPPPGPYGGSSPRHGSPQFSPHMSYSGFQQPIPQPGFAPMPAAYAMSRQGSNTSVPPYHTVQQPHHGPGPHGPQGPPPHMPQGGGPVHMPNKPGGPPQGPSQSFSHLPNYGNPATLPQKPST